MPTYDYHCDDCGHEFEIFQGMLEKKLTTCPSCGGKVRRLIGAGAGIVFKGSGFYQTDYRSREYTQRAKDEKKTQSPGEKNKGEKSKGEKSETKKPSSPSTPSTSPAKKDT